MAFPVARVRYPAALDGHANGKLPASILQSIPSLHGGKATVLLRDSAARSFVAMRAAAERDGVRMETVSSYRSLAQQEAIFRERYVPHFARHTDGSVSYRTWNGVRWYHAFGAKAATPGESNHGRALADDFVTSSRWEAWMLAHAATYGWSWEIQSESWHLRYVAGDNIPPAVLAYEASLKPPSIPIPLVLPMEEPVLIINQDDPDGERILPVLDKAYNGTKKQITDSSTTPKVTVNGEAWGAIVKGLGRKLVRLPE